MWSERCSAAARQAIPFSSHLEDVCGPSLFTPCSCLHQRPSLFNLGNEGNELQPAPGPHIQLHTSLTVAGLDGDLDLSLPFSIVLQVVSVEDYLFLALGLGLGLRVAHLVLAAFRANLW